MIPLSSRLLKMSVTSRIVQLRVPRAETRPRPAETGRGAASLCTSERRASTEVWREARGPRDDAAMTVEPTDTAMRKSGGCEGRELKRVLPERRSMRCRSRSRTHYSRR